MATITPLDPALRRLARILSLGSIATLLDTTMVNIALEHLRVEFGVSVATVQWVSTAYLLALTAVLPVVATRDVTTPGFLAVFERALAVLNAFQPKQAVHVFNTVTTFVLGHVLAEAGRVDRAPAFPGGYPLI
ncbi:TetR/AcrR family transcriptional regulator C-terminal domain-containing protein, partial [Kibdelosporangium lantanae]